MSSYSHNQPLIQIICFFFPFRLDLQRHTCGYQGLFIFKFRCLVFYDVISYIEYYLNYVKYVFFLISRASKFQSISDSNLYILWFPVCLNGEKVTAMETTRKQVWKIYWDPSFWQECFVPWSWIADSSLWYRIIHDCRKLFICCWSSCL